ncbi:MAG: alpha-amylase family glycosyl hydrolase [Bacteroidales bacterium]|nr:alpha-amylase family glycosyl hydrolase [Bacteroidales bacterium]
MTASTLKIVQSDSWLQPVAEEIEFRYNLYLKRLSEIESLYGSLSDFADAYHYFGVHFDAKANGWWYREYAPAARELFLFGDFNRWHRTSHRMKKCDFGVWEIFLPYDYWNETFVHQSKIKVLVHGENGWYERIPVFSTRVVQDDNTKDFCAQLWFPEKPFSWKEDDFQLDVQEERLIYEAHIGMAQEREGVGTYREFEETILPYIKKCGYNSLQIMAIAEHPYYGSFGYHVSNLFAPSSRFGTPEELKSLILSAHKMGIAVIMDVVHSHTVKNFNEGINEFDGSPSGGYLHAGERGEHPTWDSKLFDYGKLETLRLLLSNLKYWMQEYHFDGFRFDGVTSMMYQHHGLGVEWSREAYFGNGVDRDALVYLMLSNTLIHQLNKKAVSISEDVSGMPGMTVPVSDGGFGFNYRLGMGLPDYWIRLLKTEKDEQWNMNQMWSTLMNRLPNTKTVAYCESHDQALVGDKTLAFRLMDAAMYAHMQCDDEDWVVERGMALHKMIRLVTCAIGGEAYLNFMGNEFGHPEWIDFPRKDNGWSYFYARRQWSLLKDDNLKYQFLAAFDVAMIDLEKKYHWLQSAFPVLLNIDETNKTLIFERAGLIFLFNWHPVNSIMSYAFCVPQSGNYRIVLDSDSLLYGGHQRVNDTMIYPTKLKDGRPILEVYNVNRTVLVFERLV